MTYLGLQIKTRTKRLECKTGVKSRPMHLPPVTKAEDAQFPVQRAYVGGQVRDFNGKEWK